MSLSTGTRLGSYEIVAALGAGGMGEVRQSPVLSCQSPVGLMTDDWRLMTTSPCR